MKKWITFSILLTALFFGGFRVNAAEDDANEISTKITTNVLNEVYQVAPDDIAGGHITNNTSQGIDWRIDKNGALTIKGTGEFNIGPMDQVTLSYSVPWLEYKESITSADVELSEVTDISDMFEGCTQLISVNVSKMDTSQVTKMSGMFSKCSKLESADLSGFNTSKVTNMYGVFYGCYSLKTVDVSSFDTSHVIDMGYVFFSCKSLRRLDLSHFNTTNVAFMHSMFAYCHNLEYLDLSSFTNENSFMIGSLVIDCKNLKMLNLSSIDMRSCLEQGYLTHEAMFLNCEKLKLIMAPVHVPLSIPLPTGEWKLTDGTLVTELPKSQTESVRLMKGEGCSIITFDSCDGSKVMPAISGDRGNIEELPPEPEKDGYCFGGWYTQKEGKGLRFSTDTPVQGDITVYAHWINIQASSAFLERMYENVLERASDEDGRSYWLSGMKTGNLTGSDLAKSFILSNELTSKNLSDDDFLQVMYQSFFGREPDLEGYTYWSGLLTNGMSRKYVLSRFISADEYVRLCSECGIQVGTYDSDEARDCNPLLTSYLTRCYTNVLGRRFDEDGLNYWADEIIAGRRSAKDCAIEFIHSEEFIAKNLSDDAYIQVLYQTFFGRVYDQEGYDYWMDGVTSGAIDREGMLQCFADSPEFAAIRASFGVE